MSKASDLARLMTSGSTAIHGEAGVTSSGSTGNTTNLQQGLCKVWFNHGTDFASDDSLKVSSIADDGSGELTPSFSNAFGNAEYAYSGQGIDGDKNTTFIFVEGATQATGSLPILTHTWWWHYNKGRCCCGTSYIWRSCINVVRIRSFL